MTTQTQENQRQQLYERLHAAYCDHADQKLPLRQFAFRWEMWCLMEGHTLENLVLVVEYIKRRRAAASEDKYKPSLNLYKILDDHAWFACQVNAAESDNRAIAARKRKPQDTNRQMVLRATGRPTGPADKTTTPAAVLNKTVPELVKAMREAL